MPPKAKPAARGKAAVAKAAPAPKASEPEPDPVPVAETRSVADVEAHIATLKEEDWTELAELKEPSAAVAKTLEGVLRLLGDADAASWEAASSALQDAPALLRELRALSPWGASEVQLATASEALEAANLRSLERPGTAAEVPAASPGSRAAAAGKAKAAAGKAKAKAPAAKAKAAAPAPPDPGAAAALALGMMAEALIATRRNEKPPPFPMVWPSVPFAQIHSRLQQAMLGKQTACVLCAGPAAFHLAATYCAQSDALLYDFKDMQVRLALSKTISLEGARAEVGSCLKKAMDSGRRCALLLGDAPPNMRHVCDARQVPIEAFDGEKAGDAAKTLGLEDAAPGFHVTLLAQLPKERAELLARLVPGFDEMAVLVLDSSSLPAPGAVDECLAAAAGPGLRTALRLLALPPSEAAAAAGTKAAAPAPPAEAAGAAAPAEAAAAAPTPAAGGAGTGPLVNTQEFEYLEMFGEDYVERWSSGPATADENGKPIRAGLINAKIIKYPSNPKDAKPCMQLMGGAANAPCTGLWTTLGPPLARPTEIEFEFTINGKVDLPNACLVFTEKAFEGALPDCKIGVQFMVRGGMQLAGGTGNLVRISNDGKIKNDKWNKVILKIDWKEKVIIGQVDTQGKGYAPAIQTVPFRDPNCEGFGFIYIYNTDVQATSWFHSLRVHQSAEALVLDTSALDARKEMADRLKQREYQAAVDADMAVGMKMGAIKSTAQHGMNLAQEQACNSSSAAGAAMG